MMNLNCPHWSLVGPLEGQRGGAREGAQAAVMSAVFGWMRGWVLARTPFRNAKHIENKRSKEIPPTIQLCEAL